jgi:hypothetical protein
MTFSTSRKFSNWWHLRRGTRNDIQFARGRNLYKQKLAQKLKKRVSICASCISGNLCNWLLVYDGITVMLWVVCTWYTTSFRWKRMESSGCSVVKVNLFLYTPWSNMEEHRYSSIHSSSSSIGITAHCGLWPVEQCPSTFSYLPLFPSSHSQHLKISV